MALTSYGVDESGIALLRLERDEARNAINTGMLEEILGHLASARDDDAVRVLVISSNDHLGLSAGADVGVPVGPARLVTLGGLSPAKNLLSPPRNAGADEARRMGLIHRVAPAA